MGRASARKRARRQGGRVSSEVAYQCCVQCGVSVDERDPDGEVAVLTMWRGYFARLCMRCSRALSGDEE